MVYLFAGDEFYPHGGWHDFIGAAETVGEAQELFATWLVDQHLGDRCEWGQIVIDGVLRLVWGTGGFAQWREYVAEWTELEPILTLR